MMADMRRTLLLSLLVLVLGATAASAIARGMTVEERRVQRMEKWGIAVPYFAHSSSASSAFSAETKYESTNQPDYAAAAALPGRRTNESPTAPVFDPPPPIPILVYHHIRPTTGYAKSTWSWKMSVTPSVFERHMQWLTDKGYTTIDLDTFACIMARTCGMPKKPVVITFDDNNRSQYERAFPILQRHGFTGVFYLVANRLDNKANILREEVREMVGAGMDIQSHTMTHAWLTHRTADQLTWELAESRRILEELTGTPVRHVAYPSVMHNAVVRARAQELGYVTGSIMDPRNAKDTDDRFKLPRIMMTDDTVLGKVLQ